MTFTRKTSSSLGALLAIGVSAIALAGPAQAQEAAASNDSDIVVTARKARERLQDVPISVNALSGDQLRDRGAVDVKDILRSVPGLSFSGTERGLGNYNIRGISTVASAPTVGIYLDDISLVTIATSFSGAFDPVFFDMERIEVLKGPQGTLYGGNSMGGAIKYVSARPNLSEVGGSAAVGAATTAHGSLGYNAEGIVNLPIV
jgi:iron complex outermembrane recepter protein